MGILPLFGKNKPSIKMIRVSVKSPTLMVLDSLTKENIDSLLNEYFPKTPLDVDIITTSNERRLTEVKITISGKNQVVLEELADGWLGTILQKKFTNCNIFTSSKTYREEHGI
jgi:hypothetical protein